MSEIRIYLEGGGESAEGKALLRQGMDGFLAPLKRVARERHCRWNLVACEGRDHTLAAFRHAITAHKDAFNMLLVDSEDLVTTADPVAHLAARDGWDMTGIDPSAVHLMVQCTEAWIAADPTALSSYYGKGFLVSALPKRSNLEEEPKANIYAALEHATAKTSKGTYSKGRHAAQLLLRLDSARVRKRCPHANRLFNILAARITAG